MPCVDLLDLVDRDYGCLCKRLLSCCMGVIVYCIHPIRALVGFPPLNHLNKSLRETRLEKCDYGLKDEHDHYRRISARYESFTFLSWAQPYVAWCGLLGCFLVFAFTSATWWSQPASFPKVAVAYAAVCCVRFILPCPPHAAC